LDSGVHWNDRLSPNVLISAECLGLMMLNAIAAFFRSWFAAKSDNYKALLIADLGIER
jgi:hypothetical protein